MRVSEALQGGLLFVAVQPIIDLRRRRVYAHEALLRSRTPAFKSPPAILEQAIEERCIGELGRELRKMATATCPDGHLFLNLHPNEFDERWLVQPDDPIFGHTADIFLEITESVPLSHFELCHTILKEIRGRGMRLAVDDLGAGYSNLKYIADLSPEIVKLDRDLIAGLTRQSRLQRLVRSIVNLCHDMGAKVVAEGVEQPSELEAILETGADFAQGYLFARPAEQPPEVNWGALAP